MAGLAEILRPLDPAGAQPLYQQLQRAIREAIETRVLAPDDALPAERQIASELAVSRITVRKAIDGLVEEGLLVRRQGSGNFVCSRIEKNFAKLTSFSEDMRARGRAPRSEWLKRSEGAVTPEEALTLRLSPGAPVYRFHRLRYADDTPMCLEYATISSAALPSLSAVGASLYEALEAAGTLAQHGAGAVAARARRRRGAPRRARGLPPRRQRHRVLPDLFSRRYLRLRRRAELSR